MKPSFRPFLIGGLFLLMVFLGGFFWWQSQLVPVNPSVKEKTNFVIRKGESISEISERLSSQKLIRNPLSFKILVFFLGISKKIQAGSFFLSSSMGTKELALVLTKGSNDLRVTIIEGWRQEQIAQALIEQGFEVDIGNWNLEVKKQNLEGKLFPDTYLFPRGASQGIILGIINKNFQKKVLIGLDTLTAKSRLTLEEILILASIVEREAKSETDRRLIAGILLKRWRADWPLQADATVQYVVANVKCPLQGKQMSRLPTPGTGGQVNVKCDWWQKSLGPADLRIKSPYNTYLNRGFPPGPICNPGLSAIKAVLSPQDSPYWFYLTGNDDVMHYAKTAEEHAENIRKYLR